MVPLMCCHDGGVGGVRTCECECGCAAATVAREEYGRAGLTDTRRLVAPHRKREERGRVNVNVNVNVNLNVKRGNAHRPAE